MPDGPGGTVAVWPMITPEAMVTVPMPAIAPDERVPSVNNNSLSSMFVGFLQDGFDGAFKQIRFFEDVENYRENSQLWQVLLR